VLPTLLQKLEYDRLRTLSVGDLPMLPPRWVLSQSRDRDWDGEFECGWWLGCGWTSAGIDWGIR
jgi:hypothetical protein